MWLLARAYTGARKSCAGAPGQQLLACSVQCGSAWGDTAPNRPRVPHLHSQRASEALPVAAAAGRTGHAEAAHDKSLLADQRTWAMAHLATRHGRRAPGATPAVSAAAGLALARACAENARTPWQHLQQMRPTYALGSPTAHPASGRAKPLAWTPPAASRQTHATLGGHRCEVNACTPARYKSVVGGDAMRKNNGTAHLGAAVAFGCFTLEPPLGRRFASEAAVDADSREPLAKDRCWLEVGIPGDKPDSRSGHQTASAAAA